MSLPAKPLISKSLERSEVMLSAMMVAVKESASLVPVIASIFRLSYFQKRLIAVPGEGAGFEEADAPDCCVFWVLFWFV